MAFRDFFMVIHEVFDPWDLDVCAYIIVLLFYVNERGKI